MIAVSDPPVLLLACFGVDVAIWRDQIARNDAGIELRVWPDIGDPATIDYVLVWNPPPGFWSRLTGLRAIFSMGAGVDRLLGDPELPSAVPVIRMVDPSLVAGMVEFVIMRTLHYHLQVPAYERQQALGNWKPLPMPPRHLRRIGILGIGQLGQACADALSGLGFDVAAWGRSPRDRRNIAVHSGPDGLAAMLGRSEILICLLPLTPDTSAILNRALFAQMPLGAHLINVARGRHLVEDDLLAAIADGQIAHATLDVFEQEPLSPGHPFWANPRISVFPHIAALTRPETAAATLVANLRRHVRGESIADTVDRGAGY